MTKRKKETPSIVGDGVKETSQKDSSHSSASESLFHPDTLEDFIKSVTDEDGKVDLLLAHNMRMPLIVTTLFADDLTPSKHQQLNKLEEEINSWMLATALPQLRQVYEYQQSEKAFRKTWGEGIKMIREIENLLLVFMFMAGGLLPEQQRMVDAVQAAISNWRGALR